MKSPCFTSSSHEATCSPLAAANDVTFSLTPSGSVARTKRILDAFELHIEPGWPVLIFATSVEHAQTLAALLEDRIRFFEGRPQRYGTQLDWDAEGNLSPGDVEEPERLDHRRRAAGLPSLGEQMEDARDRARAEGEGAPVDHAGYVRARDAWAERLGWRTR